MRATTALICLAVLVSACAANPMAHRQATGDKLYEAVAGGKQPMLAVIDSRSHVPDRTLVLGTPSLDWKHVYTTVGTSLVETDASNGEVQATLPLGGVYHLPAATANGMPGGLSPNGRWLAVEDFDGTLTRVLVIDTATLTIARHVALPGEFLFDAVDDQAHNLYLIERLGGGQYYVRLYDLTAGALDPNIVVDKSDGSRAMAGIRLSGIPSADGQWLFSIYVRAHQAPFIHALNLDAPFALCLDLPGRGYLDDPAEMQWSLAASPHDGRIFAVNAATGDVAVVTDDNGAAPVIARTAHFVSSTGIAAQMRGANDAVISGVTLIAGGPTGLTWIDTTSLAVEGRSIPDQGIVSVGLSPDGKHLYAVSADGQIRQVAVESGAAGATFDPLLGAPMGLIRVAAA